MTVAEGATAAPPHRWLRVGLTVVAAIELLDALSGIENIFTDYHHDTALLRFAQALMSVKLALTPVIAGTALIYAASGNFRRAILALAALVLTTWLLDDLPSIAIHGFELSPDIAGAEVFARRLVYPAVAIAGAALALKDRQLALAGLLVSVPTIVNWAGVAAFAIAVMIYGF